MVTGYRLRLRRFFQIRNDNKPVNKRLYATLAEAAGVLVRNHTSDCEVVELDTPGGVVDQRITFVECEEIVRPFKRTNDFRVSTHGQNPFAFTRDIRKRTEQVSFASVG